MFVKNDLFDYGKLPTNPKRISGPMGNEKKKRNEKLTSLFYLGK